MQRLKRTIEERNKLAEKNTKLVPWVVNRICHSSKSYLIDYLGGTDEAVSIGWFGLLRAAEYWDENYGTTFSTYAGHAIYRKIQDEATRKNNRKRIHCVSLGSWLERNVITPLRRIPRLSEEDQEFIREGLAGLPSPDREIMESILYGRKTYEEASAPYGKSREWTRIIYRRSLLALRELAGE